MINSYGRTFTQSKKRRIWRSSSPMYLTDKTIEAAFQVADE